MAGHSEDQEIREFKKDREQGAEFYLGFTEQGSGSPQEAIAPYKLEPDISEIEDFLTRLRQEGL